MVGPSENSTPKYFEVGLRIFQCWEVRLDNSVPRVTVGHHKGKPYHTEYLKIPKYLDNWKIAVIILKFH